MDMQVKIREMTALYVERDAHVLMLYRIGSRVGPPSWRGIGGHLEKEELGDAYACVLREMEEETLLRREMLADLRLKYVTMRLKDGEIRQNYYFFATLRAGVEIALSCNEGRLEWVDEARVLELYMPPSAKAALEHYYALGRNDDRLYGGVTTENGVTFTPFEEF